jgi:hypothetical protein
MKLALKIGGGLVAAVALGLVLWTALTLNYSYSTGERAGYAQKISRKGWICKTWEGELAISNIPGQLPQIFEYTVRDDAVAHQIEALAGQRVVLSYEQHPGIPTSCFGDTDYFVVRVAPMDRSAAP